MSSHALVGIEQRRDGQLVDEWILENLRWNGAQTLDHLSRLFPKTEEARLLFAVDRLSRSGKVVISPHQGGDYLISARASADWDALEKSARSGSGSRKAVQSGVR